MSPHCEGNTCPDERKLDEVFSREFSDWDETTNPSPGNIVTKWIAIVEVCDVDGRRRLQWCTSESMAPWDARGVLLSVVDELDPPSVVMAGGCS